MTESTENKTTPVTIGGRFLIDLSHGAYTSVATALKEYISNGWDAGAFDITVRILNPDDISNTVVEILDDGCGMNHNDLENKFFRVGRDRRREEGRIVNTIRGKRTIHGRKGLGKLAGLKLADSLSAISWTKTSLEGAHLSLKEIERNPNEKPLIHWEKTVEKPNDAKEHGTLIRLEDYSRNRTIDMEELR